MEWIRLQVLNNCFRDKCKKHLGFKHEDKWYALTHNANNGILIPKSCLRMKEISCKTQFLKRLYNTAPNILKSTNMFLVSSLVENYDTIINF